ncbi:MAG: hypothetical protein ACREQX_01945 [Candidatus Binataceae bacterium]
MKKYSVMIASLAVLFLSGCFYSHTERVIPAQPTAAAPPPGQTITTTTTNDNGTIKRRTTTTYSNN